MFKKRMFKLPTHHTRCRRKAADGKYEETKRFLALFDDRARLKRFKMVVKTNENAYLIDKPELVVVDKHAGRLYFDFGKHDIRVAGRVLWIAILDDENRPYGFSHVNVPVEAGDGFSFSYTLGVI